MEFNLLPDLQNNNPAPTASSNPSSTPMPKETMPTKSMMAIIYFTPDAEKLAKVAAAIEAIERDPKLRDRLLAALESGSMEALREIPGIGILLAALEGWQEG